MAMHLHTVTGHRPPLRLARALVISGADAKLVRAAKEVKCEICHELQPVKTRRPADLPRVRNFGDRVYTDLFSLHGVQGNTFWVAHAVDAATRYQVARVLENKSSQQVVRFFRECWFNVLGTPAAVTADMGLEFVSDQFQQAMDYHDVVLHHIPVIAPWTNGVAERAGGALKTIMRAVIHSNSAIAMMT